MHRNTTNASRFASLAFLFVLIGGCNSRPEETSPGAGKETASGQDPRQIQTEESQETATFEQRLDRADELLTQEKFQDASKILRDLLVANPEDPGVLFRLASVSAANGSLAEAIDLLADIPLDSDNAEAGLAALGQSADWCIQLERYDEAEDRYRRILKFAPNATPAIRQLAFLLNRQGRRHEASKWIRELCKQGNVMQDELHSLIVVGNAMYDAPDSTPAKGTRAYWPIGAAGTARWLFTELRFQETVATLQPDFDNNSLPAEILALYGRATAETQDDDRFFAWLRKCDAEVRDYSDYWAAIGTYLVRQRRFEEAARALGEAMDRDPTDMISIGRLRQSLLALNQTELAETWEQRWEQIREIVRSNNRVVDAKYPDPGLLDSLASKLFSSNRKLEGILWKWVSISQQGNLPQATTALMQQKDSIISGGQSFPNQQQRLCGLDLSNYKTPELDIPAPTSKQTQSLLAAQKPDAQFENIAQTSGVDHAFSVSDRAQESGFAIYQFFGGAVVAFDYDLDGGVDLYLGQGAATSPSFQGDETNQLYRCEHDAERLRWKDLTRPAKLTETRYSTGVTAGDWNQDGFPDIVVCNIGDDHLMINNGDGTFSLKTLVKNDSLTRTPTSVAMGDVTGDALPDIFQIAYVDDENLARRPKRNASGQVVSALVPTDFQPAKNRLFQNSPNGQHRLAKWDEDGQFAATSLGVFITNVDNKPGNEIFVGNDLYPNHLWQRDSSGKWIETATVLGCAYGYTANATASMGVAVGDFDRSGTLDIHVTNYQQDAANLFLQDKGSFQDLHVRHGLGPASRTVLGFGSQALDFDNNGSLDLAVTNGHVEKEASGAPFKQLPQLFGNAGPVFELTEVDDGSGYWSSKHLGRGMSRLDFNRDGKMDLAITHLGEPTALLENQTESSHHWLQLELVGTRSERDATGTVIQVKSGDQTLTDWVVGGDGYFCKNEAIVAFGLGDVSTIDELSIIWPTGKKQEFEDVATDRRLLIIQNQQEVFTR